VQPTHIPTHHGLLKPRQALTLVCWGWLSHYQYATGRRPATIGCWWFQWGIVSSKLHSREDWKQADRFPSSSVQLKLWAFTCEVPAHWE